MKSYFFLSPISFLCAMRTVAIWCHTGSWHFPEIKEKDTVDPILPGGSGEGGMLSALPNSQHLAQ